MQEWMKNWESEQSTQQQEDDELVDTGAKDEEDYRYSQGGSPFHGDGGPHTDTGSAAEICTSTACSCYDY